MSMIALNEYAIADNMTAAVGDDHVRLKNLANGVQTILSFDLYSRGEWCGCPRAAAHRR